MAIAILHKPPFSLAAIFAICLLADSQHRMPQCQRIYVLRNLHIRGQALAASKMILSKVPLG